MFYETHPTIPANTAQTAPLDTDVPIHPGIVKRVEIHFPPGCAALVHVQIYHWERQVWPSNPDSSFVGDTFPITWSEDYAIVDPPFVLTVKGWNDDELYPHAPIIRFQIERVQVSVLDRLATAIFGSQPLLPSARG